MPATILSFGFSANPYTIGASDASIITQGYGSDIVGGTPIIVQGYIGKPSSSIQLINILEAIQQQVVSTQLYTLTNCIITKDLEPFPSPSGPMCLIAIDPSSFTPQHTYGGGRATTVIDFIVTIRSITNAVIDVPYFAQGAITSIAPYIGFFNNCIVIMNAIQGFLPIDPATGAAMTIEPVLFTRFDGPDYYAETTDYIYIDSIYVIRFAQQMTINPAGQVPGYFPT